LRTGQRPLVAPLKPAQQTLYRLGGDRSRCRRRQTPLPENGGIEIGRALGLAPRLDAHAVAEEEDGLGLAFASAGTLGGGDILRRRETGHSEAGGSHGREQYPIGWPGQTSPRNALWPADSAECRVTQGRTHLMMAVTLSCQPWAAPLRLIQALIDRGAGGGGRGFGPLLLNWPPHRPPAGC
jgi:hypothetical protein